MRSARRLMAAALAALGVLASWSAAAWAGGGYEAVTGSFGGPCTTSPCPGGEFDEPTGLAVNDGNGDVYVLDKGDDRIEWFSAEGKSYGGQFNGSGEYETGGEVKHGTAAGFGGQPGEIETGKFLEPTDIAIDDDPSSASYGDVYVPDTGHHVIDKFTASGEYLGQLTGFDSRLLNVAVSPSGNVYVDDYEEFYEYTDTDSLERQFHLRQGGSGPGEFAVDAEGDVFVATETALPGEPPDINAYVFVKGTEERINVPYPVSGQRSLSMAVVGATGRLLMDVGGKIEQDDPPYPENIQLRSFPEMGLSESAGIAVDGEAGEGLLYASQRVADNVEFFNPGAPEAPKVVSENATAVNAGNAQLSAVVNPGDNNTTVTFEYAREAAVNGEELELEGTIRKVTVEAPVPGEFGNETATYPEVVLINPSVDATYYYRAVATNSFGTATGKVQTYTRLPTVAGEGVRERTPTSVELVASVNPVYAQENTRYRFEYAESEQELKEGKGIVAEGAGGELGGEIGEPKAVNAHLFSLVSGRTYYYRVVVENEATEYANNLNKGAPVTGPILTFEPYAPPAVVTGAATNITGTAATLSGEVNPEEVQTTYHFAYIDEAGFQAALANGAANPSSPNYREQLANGAPSPYAEGETTASSTLPAGEQPEPVGPIPASGLLPGVTYHYALVAVNQFTVQTIGPDRTFTATAATPPVVSTGAASGISQNSATLSGTVATNGLQTNYGFEIGTAPGVYSPATGLGAVGGSQTQTVSVTLGELQPGTTYYYRVTATNADGITHGEPVSFTTPGFPTLLTAPQSLPVIPSPSVAFPSGSQENTATAPAKAKHAKAKVKKRHKARRRKRKQRSRRSAGRGSSARRERAGK
ncbi:MAG TPA: hypothetical protein VNV42_10080 [Solirubrobacteraceae bacterium]|jgi:hypothetical protein|nr:hypothetical protein [Solirubrobacteraceae bacterium]